MAPEVVAREEATFWLEMESQATQQQQELWEGSSGEQLNNEGLARSLLSLEAPVLQTISL